MAEDDTSSEAKPTWHEREITQALQRLANARAQLASLEEQVQAATDRPGPDPADVARAKALEADIAKLTRKASGRFGGSARAKLDDAQRQLHLVLERLGVERLEDLDVAAAAPAVDATVLDFARRECADAQQAFLEVTAMVMPDAEPEADEPDAEVIPAGTYAGGDDDELDLRIEPSAAS
jgi:hypothetical protein